MRVYPLNRVKKFDYKRECDVCGWDYLRSELKKRWDGAIVCRFDFEEKHPRDFPRQAVNQRPFKRD